MRRWTRLVDPPATGVRNMAVDHALALTAVPGRARLRLYRWARPTISFGRNEPAARLYDLDRARRSGYDLVRRPTGGRAVLHDAELTYAVVLPTAGLGGLREAYRRIHQGLAAAIRALGVPADLAPSGAAAAPDAGPCFAAPAAGEVVVDGAKLVGSAQARLGEAILQHGSILIDGSQAPVNELRLDREGVGPTNEPTTLANVLGGTPAWEDVAAAVTEGVRAAFDEAMCDGTLEGAAAAEATRLESCYASASWTLRR